jgi:uncharacterized membrane protein
MQTHGIVPVIVPIHVDAGGLALAFGYVALYAAKGAPLHRMSGILFVYAMLTMSCTARSWRRWSRGESPSRLSPAW